MSCEALKNHIFIAQYLFESERLKSLSFLSDKVKIQFDLEDLAREGFYCPAEKPARTLCCFFCGLLISNITVNFDFKTIHRTYSKNCAVLYNPWTNKPCGVRDNYSKNRDVDLYGRYIYILRNSIINMQYESQLKLQVSETEIMVKRQVIESLEQEKEMLKRQIQTLEEEKNCKICFSQIANIVLLPCSHMTHCHDCFKRIEKCSICNANFTGYFKIYK